MQILENYSFYNYFHWSFNYSFTLEMWKRDDGYCGIYSITQNFSWWFNFRQPRVSFRIFCSSSNCGLWRCKLLNFLPHFSTLFLPIFNSKGIVNLLLLETTNTDVRVSIFTAERFSFDKWFISLLFPGESGKNKNQMFHDRKPSRRGCHTEYFKVSFNEDYRATRLLSWREQEKSVQNTSQFLYWCQSLLVPSYVKSNWMGILVLEEFSVHW